MTKIAEYKQIGTDQIFERKMIQDFDSNGNFVGTHEEIIEREVPRYGVVYRNSTPEEDAEAARAQAESEAIEANREPTTEEKVDKLMQMQDKTVSISRFEFDLLEMTYADTTYRIMEDDGTITTIKGEF